MTDTTITRQWSLMIDAHTEAEGGEEFVEITDSGLLEADEIIIRAGKPAFKFASATNNRQLVWTRLGLELLYEALDEYLGAAEERT